MKRGGGCAPVAQQANASRTQSARCSEHPSEVACRIPWCLPDLRPGTSRADSSGCQGCSWRPLAFHEDLAQPL
eukprot:11206404-Alexandrium_andersonii.AAC.1